MPATPINSLQQGDCLKRFAKLKSDSIDLVFADPPFNIGYSYDVYEDRRASEDYLEWCRKWIQEIRRTLKPNGSFWLAIGDEFAAELKLIAQHEAAFQCRSWVIWYYTFGVNCVRGFSRSHTHLFHFVCDPDHFTFNHDNPLVRVPSARQLVYADGRANPKGRLPDNTWIYRPQDAAPSGFATDHDTWYFARVAGTFKEREGFHGCQMPEQLLGRIIRVSSNPRDVVLDPFAGSGTTLAVAKKLGRQWLGFELSRDYAKRIRERLAKTSVGDDLDGPADPIKSAPQTHQGRTRGQLRGGRMLPQLDEQTAEGIVKAYQSACQGESTDHVLCRPDLNRAFVKACKQKKLTGTPYAWNRFLLRIRKAGKLPPSKQRTQRLRMAEMEEFSHAAEIAMRTLAIDYRLPLDEILCDPNFALEFDEIAAQFAPGYTAYEYRWAAMTIRKRAKQAKSLAVEKFSDWQHRELPDPLRLNQVPPTESGVYVVWSSEMQPLYVGESKDVSRRVAQLSELEPWQHLQARFVSLVDCDSRHQHGLQSMLTSSLTPLLNSELLHVELTDRKTKRELTTSS